MRAKPYFSILDEHVFLEWRKRFIYHTMDLFPEPDAVFAVCSFVLENSFEKVGVVHKHDKNLDGGCKKLSCHCNVQISFDLVFVFLFFLCFALCCDLQRSSSMTPAAAMADK